MRRLSLGIAAVLVCAAAAPLDEGWRIIGPGGGGSLYHPTVSPHDSRTALVACDMTGAYITHDGGATWQRYFPRNVQKITMGDDHAAGLLHTTGEPSGEVTAMAIDPADSRAHYL